MDRFHIANPCEIIDGKVTDAYFVRSLEILHERNIHKNVVMEIRAASLPEQWPWAVLAGVEEVLYFLERIDKPLAFYSLDEGEFFRAGDPVGYLIGDYQDICVYETALLGLLCQATGIATRAARCVKAADGRPVLSFGGRRLHPAIAPMADRSAYLGGCNGYSNVLTAELLGGTAAGTMPHALIMLVGDTVEATKLFHEIIDPSIPRISLIDTFEDEKFATLRVAEALGKDLYGVRLDTPSSRRGDFLALLKEVRWELDLRGHSHVKLIASGGLNEYTIPELNPCCDGYGVGTSVCNAPVVDFALDIVELDGQPVAKRGKYSSRKRLLKNPENALERTIVPWKSDDGLEKSDALQLKIQNGKRIYEAPPVDELRERVVSQLEAVSLED